MNFLKIAGCLGLLSSLILFSCRNNAPKEASVDAFQVTDNFLPEWTKNSNIYEVNVRQYTPEGTFNSFSDHLPRLKDMGVDMLWFMPIFPISQTKKKGTLGSYYAVTDFRKANPEFGTDQDFDNLIQKIHAYKMKVILDWVPNHTGWDHVWIKSNPDFYTQDKDGNIIDPINAETGESWGWTDVADLNYDNKEMRAAMIADLVYWVKEKNIDGYRMDVAHGVPNDFWLEVSDTLRKIKPDVFLLAEAEIPEQLNNGSFHACYGWSFHHILNGIAKGEKTVKDLATWRKDEFSKFNQGIMMHFTSNHDENSWAGTEMERMGDGHQAFAVLTHTYDGIPLIYSGQEEPLQRRLEFFEKDNIGFANYKYSAFYRTLNNLKKDNPALWNGKNGGPVEMMADSEKIAAYSRKKGDKQVTVLINLSNQIQKTKINTDIPEMTDVFTGKKQAFKNGSEITMEPWQYIVLSK